MADIKFSGRTGARAARGYPGAAGAAGADFGAARTCREFGGRGRSLPQSLGFLGLVQGNIHRQTISVWFLNVFLWAMFFLMGFIISKQS